MAEKILELENVKTHFPVYSGFILKHQTGTVKAVDGVNLHLEKGEALGLVGESGCGKSTLARSITQLIPPTDGVIQFKDKTLNDLSSEQLKKVRTDLQMIFQDPYASLNPRMTVFDTLAEPLIAHNRTKRKNTSQEVSTLMEKVGLSPRLMRKYPHEFSGGQRQRIAIARALALNPSIIVADEPVSALDVSIQAQILNLLSKLRKEFDLSIIFIAHDLSVVKHISDRIAVMYLGKIVEIGDAIDIIENPRHPYTQALVSAIPVPDPEREKARKRTVLLGDPPSPINPPSGCSFHPRCLYATEECAKITPALAPTGKNHSAACIRIDEIGNPSAP